MIEPVPFGSSDPDPESDVVARISRRLNCFACLRCRLSPVGTTEATTVDEMIRHFDAHRSAGDRVPGDYYESLIECRYIEEEFLNAASGAGHREVNNLLLDDLHESQVESSYFEEEILGSFSLRRFDQTAKVSVIRTADGRCLLCNSCSLNGGAIVECFSTRQMTQHLDLHRSRGTPVSKLDYEMLQLARSTIDRAIETYYAERLQSRPSEPRWEPLTCSRSFRKLAIAEKLSRAFARCWSLLLADSWSRSLPPSRTQAGLSSRAT